MVQSGGGMNGVTLANASDEAIEAEIEKRHLAKMASQPPRKKDAVDLAVSPSCNYSDYSEIDARDK